MVLQVHPFLHPYLHCPHHLQQLLSIGIISCLVNKGWSYCHLSSKNQTGWGLAKNTLVLSTWKSLHGFASSSPPALLCSVASSSPPCLSLWLQVLLCHCRASSSPPALSLQSSKPNLPQPVCLICSRSCSFWKKYIFDFVTKYERFITSCTSRI